MIFGNNICLDLNANLLELAINVSELVKIAIVDVLVLLMLLFTSKLNDNRVPHHVFYMGTLIVRDYISCNYIIESFGSCSP